VKTGTGKPGLVYQAAELLDRRVRALIPYVAEGFVVDETRAILRKLAKAGALPLA
jgi:hypothetical protein